MGNVKNFLIDELNANLVDRTKKTRKKKYTNEIDRKNALKGSKSKYMLNKPWFCTICNNNHDYKLAGKTAHLRTLKHIKNIEKYENMINPERDC